MQTMLLSVGAMAIAEILPPLENAVVRAGSQYAAPSVVYQGREPPVQRICGFDGSIAKGVMKRPSESMMPATARVTDAPLLVVL